MAKLVNLFRGRRPPSRNISALVAPLAVPAIQLIAAGEQTDSHLGGRPACGTQFEWPCKEGKPLTFLASINLRDARAVHPLPWLPAEGRLLFFYDAERQPWGFDPKDRGSWAVVHVDDGREPVRPPDSLPILPQQYVSLRRIATYPSWERPDVEALRLSDMESDDLIDFCTLSYGGAPAHQIGGYPSPVQGDGMELECQLASHGINCGDLSGFQDPAAKALQEGAGDWRLLLQLESDGSLDVMWGDAGNLYFWIREQDARARRFDRAWVILQCC